MAITKREKGKGKREEKMLPPSSFHFHPSKRGFSLLEVLVALVIFGIITLALSGAMTAGLRGRVLAEQRQEDSESTRGVFSILGRDLQSAYGSMYDPNSLFMTGGSGGSSGQSSSSGALLTLSTQSHRITTTDSGVDPTVDTGQAGSSPFSSAQSGGNDPPQQSVALVRYDLNPQAGTLSRHEQLVPNAQTIQQATPDPQEIIANNIVSLKIQLWDPNTQSWRDSWDFEQPNLPAPDTAASTMGFPAPAASSNTASATSGTSGTSATSATPANPNLPSASSTGTGDVGLPSAVQIMLTIRKANGTPGTYTTILPIASPRVQDYPYQGGMSTDPNAPPAKTTGGTGSATGGGQ